MADAENMTRDPWPGQAEPPCRPKSCPTAQGVQVRGFCLGGGHRPACPWKLSGSMRETEEARDTGICLFIYLVTNPKASVLPAFLLE